MKYTIYLFLFFLFVSTSNTIQAQEITMFPGFGSLKYYEDDNRVSAKEVGVLMQKVPEAHQSWQKSKKHFGIGIAALGAEIGFIVWQLNRAADNKSQTVPFLGVLGSGAVAIGFALSSTNLKKKAILRYNNKLEVGYLNLGLAHNGVGIAMEF